MEVKVELYNSFPFYHERRIEKILKFVSDVMHSGPFSKLNIAAYTFMTVLLIFHGAEYFTNCSYSNYLQYTQNLCFRNKKSTSYLYTTKFIITAKT